MKNLTLKMKMFQQSITYFSKKRVKLLKLYKSALGIKFGDKLNTKLRTVLLF